MSALQLFKTQHVLRNVPKRNVLKCAYISRVIGFPLKRGQDLRKNGIYSIERNATEFVIFWMNKRSVTKFESQYELVYVNIKTQKDGLNMNPACSVRYVWMAETRFCLLIYTNTEAHVNSRWFSASASCYMTTWTFELTGCESHLMRILPFHLRKLASYHTVYTQKLHGNLSK